MYIISSVTQDNIIGVDGNLPFHIPYDLKWFKMNTYGCAIIMGRKTWDSLPKKPLPGRLNIVLSRSYREKINGDVYWATSLEEALALADYCNKRPVCIGGGEIFRLALLNRKVNGVILTRIHKKAPHGRRQEHLILPVHIKKHWRSKTFTHKNIDFHFEVYSNSYSF